MKFMMLMIPKVYQPDTPFEGADEDFAPPKEDVAEMEKFNEELSKAVTLISVEGFRPRSMGARVAFSNGNVNVTDGPDIKTKEVVGGYWLIDAKSKEDVVEWAKKVPAQDGDVIEIRPIFEM
jgi:hypothetical protein